MSSEKTSGRRTKLGRLAYQKMKTKITALMPLFLALFSRAIFGAESVDGERKKAEAGDADA